jgi:hypothetical protein
MPYDVGMLSVPDLGFLGMLQVIGIDTMHHVHRVTGIPQGVRDPVKINGVSAETVRWVEGCEI